MSLMPSKQSLTSTRQQRLWRHSRVPQCRRGPRISQTMHLATETAVLDREVRYLSIVFTHHASVSEHRRFQAAEEAGQQAALADGHEAQQKRRRVQNTDESGDDETAATK